MLKKLLFGGTISVLFVAICFIICGIRVTKAIPLLNNVCFGMTPTQVERRLGDYYDFCQDIGGTGKTTYSYKTTVLDSAATVTCFFLHNKQLTEVLIKWDKNHDDLYERVYTCLCDYYSGNKNFFTKESQHPGEKYVRILIGIDDGATGFFYNIYRTDEYILISCTDNS